MPFPVSPEVGDTHTTVDGTYMFNGISWTQGFAVRNSDGSTTVVSPNEPTSFTENTKWVDYVTRTLKSRENDSWVARKII